MKRIVRLTGLFAVLSALLLAADVAGTWKGAFDFNGTNVPLTITLKTSGEAVTGTVEGLPTPVAEIHDGKLQGDTITFWVTTDYDGSTYKLLYKGKVSGDQIQFTFGTEDDSWSTQLTVKRGS
ncbi:MAG: hypothetical protein ABSH40_11610 [Bryobacteraceae bacterium]|jgi:hypothetical protein